jgi:hypothetical protein
MFFSNYLLYQYGLVTPATSGSNSPPFKMSEPLYIQHFPIQYRFGDKDIVIGIIIFFNGPSHPANDSD